MTQKQFIESKIEDLGVFLKELEISNYTRHFILSKLSTALKEMAESTEKELIEEYRNGERCVSCGAKMENGLSTWCGECLENN